MSSNNQPPTSRRDNIALQFMLAMTRDTALTPDVMAARAYAMTDAFVAHGLKPAPVPTLSELLARRGIHPTPYGDYDVPSPAPANHGKPFDKSRADEIPF